MARIIKEITLDVAKENRIQAIVAKQNDSNSRFLKITMENEGEKITVPASATAIINALRADGEAKAFMAEINDDGTVTAPLTSWMLALDDTVSCSISILGSEETKLTTMSFQINVQRSEYSGEDIEHDENYDILVNLISEVSDLKDECADSIIDSAEVVNDELILTTRGGDTFNAGNVRGPQGKPGALKSGAAPESVRNGLSTAGALGFRYEVVDYYSSFPLTVRFLPVDNQGNYIEFDDLNGKINIGDSISIKAGYSWNFAGVVSMFGPFEDQSIAVIEITFDCNDIGVDEPFGWLPDAHEYNSMEPGYFWFPHKPTIGCVPIGAGSLAIGLDNQVNEMGSLVGGCYNLCDGRYAIVFGNSNTGGFNVLIIGEENKVLGLFSMANGKKNEIYAKDALAAGRLILIEKSAEHGNGLGLGLIVRGVSQHVAGEYNVALGDEFLEIIGAGSDNSHRKNIRVQKDDGELHIAGSLYTNDNSADGKSGGSKAVTEKDVSDGNVKITGYRVYGTPIFTQWYGLNVAAGNGTVTIKSASKTDIQNAPTRGQTNYGVIDTGNLPDAFEIYGTKCGTAAPSGTAKPGARYIRYSTSPLSVIGEYVYIDDEDSGEYGWVQIS